MTFTYSILKSLFQFSPFKLVIVDCQVSRVGCPGIKDGVGGVESDRARQSRASRLVKILCIVEIIFEKKYKLAQSLRIGLGGQRVIGGGGRGPQQDTRQRQASRLVKILCSVEIISEKKYKLAQSLSTGVQRVYRFRSKGCHTVASQFLV